MAAGAPLSLPAGSVSTRTMPFLIKMACGFTPLVARRAIFHAHCGHQRRKRRRLPFATQESTIYLQSRAKKKPGFSEKPGFVSLVPTSQVSENLRGFWRKD
jgi:hypothetical protein